MNKYLDQVQIDPYYYNYFIDIPVNNQVIHIALQGDDTLSNKIWYNIYLVIYNKRTECGSEENEPHITGLNPIQNFLITREAFDALEQVCIKDTLEYTNKDIVIYCSWLDNRRRDAYYKVLSRKGYRYGKDTKGKKVIMKVIKNENKSL